MIDSNISTHFGSFTTTQNINVSRKCDGEAVQIFEALTECLPTALIRLANTGSCPIALIVRQRNNRRTIEIPQNRSFLASFDCVRVVNVRCSNSSGGTCEFLGEIEVVEG